MASNTPSRLKTFLKHWRHPVPKLRMGFWVCALMLQIHLLSACVSLDQAAEDTEKTAYTQASVSVKNVPLFKQEQFFCGPAALAMVLAQKGIKHTPEELADWVYTPDKQGSLQIEMQAAPRRAGLLSYSLSPNMQGIFDALNEGHAVVVLLNLALSVAPQWHYAVVVGYNAEQHVVILHSGRTDKESMPVKTFLRLWERSKNWGFVALRTDMPPPRFTSAQNYLNAIVALEKQKPLLALQAYQQGSSAWPTEPWFAFGRGNVHFTAGQYLEAETAFKEAVTIYPALADGWNNLAETLLELNKKNEARAAINKAISLGGARLTNYQATAEKIGL